MTEARDAVLGRIRSALADRPVAAPIPRDYDTTRPVGDVLALAAERIADYRATVHRASPDGLPALIARCLAGRSTMIAPPGLPEDWRVDGVSWLTDDPPLTVSELDGADGVLTGCAVTIAETGTIVLDAGPGQGRRALTLVPDYHLCVIHADQVVDAVPAAIGQLNPDRPLTFISGPSATSDIEFNRVEGVHGPRTLEVILVG